MVGIVIEPTTAPKEKKEKKNWKVKYRSLIKCGRRKK